MRIGILGSGEVGKSLAEGFLKHGHDVMVGSGTPGKLAEWAEDHPKGRVGNFEDAAAFAEVAVLAVRGTGAREVILTAGPANLAGKPVLDTTNPIAEGPPESGVLKYFTDINSSLMERLQEEFPGIRFVKAFNSVGHRIMVNPKFKAGRPTMFICGNDEAAKGTAIGILDQLGWDVADMGRAEAARAIEPLCMLWCIPGFLRNEWSHAFKLLN